MKKTWSGISLFREGQLLWSPIIESVVTTLELWREADIKCRRNDSVKIVKVGHTVVYGVASRVEPRSIYLVPIWEWGIFYYKNLVAQV